LDELSGILQSLVVQERLTLLRITKKGLGLKADSVTNGKYQDTIKLSKERAVCLEVQEQEKEPLEFIGVQRVPVDV